MVQALGEFSNGSAAGGSVGMKGKPRCQFGKDDRRWKRSSAMKLK